MTKCKYWDNHLATIIKLIQCLYDIEGCCCGGLLHVMIDDENIDDGSIIFTLRECLNNPDREESGIGKLICEEFSKLSMEQRRLVVQWNEHITEDGECFFNCQGCDKCYVEIGDEFDNAK